MTDSQDDGDTLRERLLALGTHEGPEKGALFERWLVETLPEIPSAEIARAWRWPDAPAALKRRAFGHSLAKLPDTGVDLLAERHDGGLIAIQAKCLHPKRRLVLDDLKQFWLKTKGNGKLAANWVVTTGEWGRTVAAHASDAGGALINAQSEWGDMPVADLGRAKPLELDDNQKAAFRACVDGLRHEDRGKLVMACGTGKTLVSLRVAEKVAPAAGLVVYATPSIALTGQSRRSWLANAKRPMRTMVVCSDEDEGAGGSTSNFTGFVSEIEAPVSTDPRTIAERADELSRSLNGVPNGMVAVFATYQSLHRICTAQEKHGLRNVDFVVADEAHRTAGKYDRDNPGPFQVVHHRLQAAKRLYQTATPRIYTKRSQLKISKMVKSAQESGANIAIQDMGDASVYGRSFHRLSFREALQATNPRLCDYRVIVLGEWLNTDADAIGDPGEVREGDDSVENTSRNTRVAALAQAMQYGTDDMEDIRSCIAFCNRVAFAGKASRLLGDRRLSASDQHRIELADLIDSLGREAIDELGELPELESFDGPALTDRFRRQDEICTKLLAVAFVAAYWSDATQIAVWRSTVERLFDHAKRTGRSPEIVASSYPAVLLVYALCLGATAHDRLDSLGRILSFQTGRDPEHSRRRSEDGDVADGLNELMLRYARARMACGTSPAWRGTMFR